MRFSLCHDTEGKEGYLNKQKYKIGSQKSRYGLVYEEFQKCDSDKTLKRKFLLINQLTLSGVKIQHLSINGML